MTIDNILLISVVFAALWTAMSRSLLKAALGLAITSAIIAIILFRLDSPLAGVFELSVCAGLITAVFISAISLMKPLTHKETIELSKERIKRYWYLPALLILACIMFGRMTIQTIFKAQPGAITENVQTILWSSRTLDLFGQIVIVLAGVFGIVILFREIKDK